MSWQPEFAAAFTLASGSQARLDDLGVTVAAALSHTRSTSGSPRSSPPCRGADPATGSATSTRTTCARTPTPRERPAHRRPGRDSAGPGMGRRAARRGGRGPVRRPGPHHRRPTEPALLRPPPRGDAAEHGQRPGRRAGRPGRVRHPARLAARDRPDLPPGRRPPPGGHHQRHRLLQRHGVRAAAATRLRLPPTAGRPARPEAVADQPGRRLRPAHHRRPRQDRPRTGPRALARYAAAGRVNPHRRGHRA